MTIKTASTLHTLQGVTATPGLIFHWKFPRFFSPELRWLATYVALSRPPSLAQLISIRIPDDLRGLIEGGPPEGIHMRFSAMLGEAAQATHLRAAEFMLEDPEYIAEPLTHQRELIYSPHDEMYRHNCDSEAASRFLR